MTLFMSCAFGFTPVRRTYDIRQDRTTRFRLSSRQYRRPELESRDVEPLKADAMPPSTVASAEHKDVVATRPIAVPTSSVAQGALPPPQSVALSESANRTTTPTGKQLKYQIAAESFAKSRLCASNPAATLVTSAPVSRLIKFRAMPAKY
jgi:hypothetical protein